LFAGLSSNDLARAKKLHAERTELETRIAEITKSPMVYGGTFAAKPEATRRLNRGDPMQPREEISPGTLGVIPVRFVRGEISSPSTTPKPLTEDQQRRLALAHWIVDP